MKDLYLFRVNASITDDLSIAFSAFYLNVQLAMYLIMRQCVVYVDRAVVRQHCFQDSYGISIASGSFFNPCIE